MTGDKGDLMILELRLSRMELQMLMRALELANQITKLNGQRPEDRFHYILANQLSKVKRPVDDRMGDAGDTTPAPTIVTEKGFAYFRPGPCPNCRMESGWEFEPPVWISNKDGGVYCPSCGKIYSENPYKIWLEERDSREVSIT